MSIHRKNDGKAPDPNARVRKFERHVVEEIEITDTATARAAARREWFTEFKFMAAWCGLWLMLVAATLFARGAWPPDETRFLGIAWEMWARRNILVPYLNGDAELHAPFFFWLVHLGWLGFGVSEWWARLVAPLGGLASLFITQRLARLLWPQEQDVARYAPPLLLGTFSFALMATATLPDTWTLLFTLVAFWALLIQWRRRDMRAWLLLGLALGLGALTAGFIMWVYVLPLAVTAPLWARAPRPQWKYWYVDILAALALASVIVALWLGAAGAAEGAPYVVRFLSHAWMGTPLAMFARNQPVWWYAWLVPVVFLPWSVLPLAWMRLWHIRREPLEDGFVFCLGWVVLPLLVLSALSVKQPQFLLPLVPASALLAARLLFGRALREVYQEKALAGMAIPLLLLGGVLMALPRLPRVEFLPALLWQQSPLVGLAIMGVGIASAWLPFRDVHRRMFDTAAVSVLLVVFVLLGVASKFNALYPMSEVGSVLAEAQTHARPIAYVGEYRGEFHFAGRLRTALAVIEPARAEAWAAAHPDGVLLTYADGWQPRAAGRAQPLLEAPFRDGHVRVFSAQQVLSVGGVPGS